MHLLTGLVWALWSRKSTFSAYLRSHHCLNNFSRNERCVRILKEGYTLCMGLLEQGCVPQGEVLDFDYSVSITCH